MASCSSSSSPLPTTRSTCSTRTKATAKAKAKSCQTKTTHQKDQQHELWQNRSDLFCHISGPPGGRPLPLVMAGGSPRTASTAIHISLGFIRRSTLCLKALMPPKNLNSLGESRPSVSSFAASKRNVQIKSATWNNL